MDFLPLLILPCGPSTPHILTQWIGFKGNLQESAILHWENMEKPSFPVDFPILNQSIGTTLSSTISHVICRSKLHHPASAGWMPRGSRHYAVDPTRDLSILWILHMLYEYVCMVLVCCSHVVTVFSWKQFSCFHTVIHPTLFTKQLSVFFWTPEQTLLEWPGTP